MVCVLFSGEDPDFLLEYRTPYGRPYFLFLAWVSDFCKSRGKFYKKSLTQTVKTCKTRVGCQVNFVSGSLILYQTSRFAFVHGLVNPVSGTCFFFHEGLDCFFWCLGSCASLPWIRPWRRVHGADGSTSRIHGPLTAPV